MIKWNECAYFAIIVMCPWENRRLAGPVECLNHSGYRITLRELVTRCCTTTTSTSAFTRLSHADGLDDLEHSWTTHYEDEETQEPGTNRVFIISRSRCFGHVSSHSDVLGGLLVGDPDSLLGGHDCWRGSCALGEKKKDTSGFEIYFLRSVICDFFVFFTWDAFFELCSFTLLVCCSSLFSSELLPSLSATSEFDIFPATISSARS